MIERAGLWIVGSGPRPPPVAWIDDCRTLVIGDLFGLDGVEAQPHDASAKSRFQALIDRAWGRYVALSFKPMGRVDAVMRDPSGSRDCVLWSQEGIQFVASTATDWLVDRLKPRWSVDWDMVADMLVEPALMSGPLALKGVVSVGPGEMRTIGDRAGNDQLWSPARCVRRPIRDFARCGTAVRDAVDRAVDAYAGLNANILVEVSGGLDSSVVASSLRSQQPSKDAVWAHIWGPYPESDERAYARGLASHLGVALTSVARPRPEPGRAMDFSPRPAFRPSLNRMDLAYDRDQAAMCERLALRGILTGKGGDVVFSHGASPLIVSDALRARGLKGLLKPTIMNTARRLRISAAAVVRNAVLSNVSPLLSEQKSRPLSMVVGSKYDPRRERHPWLADIHDLPLGKQSQIAVLAGQLSLHGPCERTSVADLLHPLMAQPVLEACLAVPTFILSGEGRDRHLARDVFGDRLPQRIVQRRSKAESTTYFGRSIDAELPALRPHLLEGRLAGRGLIDVAVMDRVLRRDNLIWENRYSDVMILAAVETWVRAWDRS